MFYSNKEAADLINGVYTKQTRPQKTLPTKSELSDKLLNREPIHIFYLREQEEDNDISSVVMEQTAIVFGSEHVNPNPWKSITMVLCQVFLYPFGANVWTSDTSFRIMHMSGVNIPIEPLDDVINGLYVRYNSDSYEGLCKTLNKEVI